MVGPFSYHNPQYARQRAAWVDVAPGVYVAQDVNGHRLKVTRRGALYHFEMDGTGWSLDGYEELESAMSDAERKAWLT